MMARKTLVDEKSSDLMLQIMSGQIYRTRIPRYLSGYRIPHKTGDFLPYIGNDVGLLIAPGRTIVISIYTANHFGDRDRLEEAIGDIARQVAQYYNFRQS
jgi:beta-lactamase class A